MNLFACTGNIGSDAETRYTKDGLAIASWSVAVKSGYGGREKTMWVKCSLFGKRAEGGLVQYLKKGSQIAVSGELSLNEWTGKDGSTKTSLELKVSEIDLIGGKKDTSNHANHSPAPAPDADFDDDIPFS